MMKTVVLLNIFGWNSEAIFDYPKVSKNSILKSFVTMSWSILKENKSDTL